MCRTEKNIDFLVKHRKEKQITNLFNAGVCHYKNL